jgi:hypothetical protein
MKEAAERPNGSVNTWLTEAEVNEVKSRLKAGLSKLEYNAVCAHAISS